MRILSITLVSFMIPLFGMAFSTWAKTETQPTKIIQSEDPTSKVELYDKEIRVQQITKTEKSWNGAQLPDYPTTQPEITVLKISIPPKAKLPVHKHPLISVAYLVKGELTVSLENNSKSLTLKPGDVDTEVINTWHYGVNHGDVTAELIVFYAGTAGVPLSINKYK